MTNDSSTLTFLFPLITLCHILLIIWGLRLYKHRRSLGLAILIANNLAIAYNMLVVSISRVIGEVFLAEGVNRSRSLPSRLLLPLLIYVTFDMVRRTGLDWAQRRAVATTLSGLAVILSLTQLMPLVFSGMINNRQSFLPSLQIPAILSLSFVIPFGLILFRRSAGPWVAVGAIGMFVGITAPLTLVGPSVGALTEMLFAFCLLRTERKLQLSKK